MYKKYLLIYLMSPLFALSYASYSDKFFGKVKQILTLKPTPENLEENKDAILKHFNQLKKHDQLTDMEDAIKKVKDLEESIKKGKDKKEDMMKLVSPAANMKLKNKEKKLEFIDAYLKILEADFSAIKKKLEKKKYEEEKVQAKEIGEEEKVQAGRVREKDLKKKEDGYVLKKNQLKPVSELTDDELANEIKALQESLKKKEKKTAHHYLYHYPYPMRDVKSNNNKRKIEGYYEGSDYYGLEE
ncbi:hypothetical protein [Holospora curviuscula]|uniref:LTXXQ motif protein n=1 Tax=Holospora curviuscula TaxID=1082868 RepID=A0A2S5R9Q7_9PROT|nr:hypothetical protein [Holospora curviuscula]PPE03932.1 hypothetical protein HCUR_00713 [Holospora curviuscula]